MFSFMTEFCRLLNLTVNISKVNTLDRSTIVSLQTEHISGNLVMHFNILKCNDENSRVPFLFSFEEKLLQSSSIFISFPATIFMGLPKVTTIVLWPWLTWRTTFQVKLLPISGRYVGKSKTELLNLTTTAYWE